MKESRSEKIKYNIDKARENIEEACLSCGRSPEEVTLMAVTKTMPVEDINVACGYGVLTLGENRVQEMLSKYEGYDKNADIQFIGALHSNKVKYIIDKVSLIHSVDSLKLAEEIGKRAVNAGKIADILIEVNIGGEESKSGIAPEIVCEKVYEISELKGIKIKGLMTIPPICENLRESSKFFENMRRLFVDIRDKKIDNVSMDILSMGMSGDYVEAIKQGSTVVRLGRALFGERKYI